MPRKRRKPAAQKPAHKPSPKHPERVDLRAQPEKKPTAAKKPVSKSQPSMSRLKKPGEDKLKRKEISRRKRAIAKKIREVERGEKRVKRSMRKTETSTRPSLVELHERDKRLIMYTGVSFFMLLIAFGWILSLKHSLKQTAANTANPVNDTFQNIDKLNDDFSKTLDQLKTGLNEISTQTQPQVDNSTSDAVTNNALPEANADKPALTDEEIMQLKDRLNQLQDNSDAINNTAEP